jgi:hypothetical protein
VAVSYVVAVSFIGGGYWRKALTFGKLKVTDELYHMMLYQVHLATSRDRTDNSVVIGSI